MLRILTRVLDRRDDEFEPVGVGAPVVCHVLERDEVAAREQRAHLLPGVPAGQVHLEETSGIC